jgi:hypothetical protein
MKKSIAVLVGLAVVFACSSAWAGWGYFVHAPAVVYRPVAPVVTYYSPVVPAVPAPAVTASPVLTPQVYVSPGAVVYPAPVVVPARVYYRPVRPFVRVWLP